VSNGDLAGSVTSVLLAGVRPPVFPLPGAICRLLSGYARDMAKRTGKGSDIPSTIQRSGKKAQETWAKAHDSAVDTYGEGERAHRTAFAALKHSHEKVGDHWEPKEEKGPSDEQAARGYRDKDLPTASGVDANASKKHLQDVARKLDVKGRSKMDKAELVDAIRKANDRETAKARG
jgi:cation transport regulator ChaB